MSVAESEAALCDGVIDGLVSTICAVHQERPELNHHVLEVLQEPLESGQIVISRALRRETFPTRFQLVAAMNPCQCGQLGDESGLCNCSSEQISRYRGRI